MGAISGEDSGRDADLLRELALVLEAAERSPPEPIFIAMDQIARDFGLTTSTIQRHLEWLARFGFIEGPGVHGENFFLFRKLTRKGRFFAQAVKNAKDWREIKKIYLADQD
jgi:DNA-binding MarR family transcriptional regulator